MMTSTIFTEWMTAWNASLRRQNRKILLLCDNCSAHPKNLVLSTHLVLPPNTTSILQPCDQGIIQTVKATYRREICRQVLREIDTSNLSAPDIAKKRNILDSAPPKRSLGDSRSDNHQKLLEQGWIAIWTPREASSICLSTDLSRWKQDTTRNLEFMAIHGR